MVEMKYVISKHLHWLVDRPNFLGKLEPTLLHGTELGSCRHIVSLEPLDIVPELPDGALPVELVYPMVWVGEVLVLIKHQPNPTGMTSVGILKARLFLLEFGSARSSPPKKT